METTAWPRERPDIVTLEMSEAVEFWTMREDGSVAIVLKVAATCWLCKTQHFWYVNRDGRTRCIDCDGRWLATTAPKFEEVRA